MNLPILQMPQPWAWATVAGLRHTHGVEAAYGAVRGPAVVIASTTNLGLGQATRFLRENGVDVPMKKDLHQGAFIGLVEIAASVRRPNIAEYLFLDEHPWQLVLVRPFQLAEPDCRPFFKVKCGLPIADILRGLRGCRDEVGRGYVTMLRSILHGDESGIL